MPTQQPIKVLDDTTLRKLAEMLGDYLRRTGGNGKRPGRYHRSPTNRGIRNISLTSSFASQTASFTFDDYEGGDDCYDYYNAWANATSGMDGMVWWNSKNQRWEVLQILDCDAIT